MRTSSPVVCAVVGVTLFGVGYDSELFGPTDGHDYAALISVAASTVSVGPSGVIYVSNNVIGEDVAVIPPDGPRVVAASS